MTKHADRKAAAYNPNLQVRSIKSQNPERLSHETFEDAQATLSPLLESSKAMASQPTRSRLRTCFLKPKSKPPPHLPNEIILMILERATLGTLWATSQVDTFFRRHSEKLLFRTFLPQFKFVHAGHTYLFHEIDPLRSEKAYFVIPFNGVVWPNTWEELERVAAWESVRVESAKGKKLGSIRMDIECVTVPGMSGVGQAVSIEWRRIVEVTLKGLWNKERYRGWRRMLFWRRRG